MRILILYHPKAEYAGLAEDYKRDFERAHPDRQLELVSLDSVTGAETAQLYDIVRYPAILAIGPDGGLQKAWQDQPWPLLDEVFSYAR